MLTLFWGSEEAKVNIERIVLSPDRERIYAIGFIGKSSVAFWLVNSGNGKIMKHEVATYAGGLSLDKLIVTKDTLVALDSSKPTIIPSDIAKGELSLHQTTLSSLFEDFSFEARLLPLKFVGAFALKVDSLILVIKV